MAEEMLSHSVWNSVHHLQHSDGSWLSEMDETFSHLPMLGAAPDKRSSAEWPGA